MENDCNRLSSGLSVTKYYDYMIIKISIVLRKSNYFNELNGTLTNQWQRSVYFWTWFTVYTHRVRRTYIQAVNVYGANHHNKWPSPTGRPTDRLSVLYRSYAPPQFQTEWIRMKSELNLFCDQHIGIIYKNPYTYSTVTVS